MTIINSEKPFTTFEVAKICGVFHTTVINWVNKGKLKARYTPGGHRRILLADLVDFMRKFDMPIPDDLTQRNKRVLVVEDDLNVQRMIVRTLRAMPEPQMDIHSCAGGLEALMSIGKEAPDLLILDIRIPQVNGLEVCRLLRSNEQTRPIKIIAISGNLLSDDEMRFLGLHTDCFFAKPLATATLKERVSELLELDTTATSPTNR
ncbi:MAG TPA: histidine kinase [Elusimicrobia bacterium]|nr:histidine kinase [Elusimicrobiota bacterium]HBT61306.1 histidine kinase [Elusimicrobiota bacterium]